MTNQHPAGPCRHAAIVDKPQDEKMNNEDSQTRVQRLDVRRVHEKGMLSSGSGVGKKQSFGVKRIA